MIRKAGSMTLCNGIKDFPLATYLQHDNQEPSVFDGRFPVRSAAIRAAYNGHIALLTKNENSAKPYEIFYKGSVSENTDRELFAAEMVTKKHSYGRYAYVIDNGLAIAAEKDRVALVNNSPIGNSGLKNPDLMCAVIDKTGLVYKGMLQNNIVDIDYGITNAELKEILQMDEKSAVQDVIKPVSNENEATWKTQ